MKRSLFRILLILVLALASIFVAYRLPYFQALDFFAIQLAMLSSLFLAFALNQGRPAGIALEFILLASLLIAILLGMWKWPWLIAAGYVVFGVWSALHRWRWLGSGIQHWLPMQLMIYCWILAAFLGLVFLGQAYDG